LHVGGILDRVLPRDAHSTLLALAELYPVVAMTGPRQSGKTTLVRAAFPDKPYASLEDPDVRDFADSDARGFLAQFAGGAVLDEAQRCPGLFSYLQGMVDAERQPGRFILTGSQQFGLLSGISQSLAGRVGLLQLLPFSLGEIAPPATLEDLLYRGLYPPVHDRRLPPHVFYADYCATYVERDVRQMINVRDVSAFRRFLRMCATRTGQAVNLSALATDCGVTHDTASAWLSVLEASYLVMRLPPHFRNLGKRLVKTPKLYFLDPGLAAWLAGIRSAEDLRYGPLRGPLFETWVVTEAVKRLRHRLLPLEAYHWRDSGGHEVDLVVEREGGMIPLECKAGATTASDWFPPLIRYLDLTGGQDGILVFGGEGRYRRDRVEVFGWREIGAALDALLGAGRGLPGPDRSA
jgi:predicted AAA+ superfamily ATPase